VVKKSKPKHSNVKLIPIASIFFALTILLLVFVVFWVYKNTSFFTKSISKEDLNYNNLNPPESTIKMVPQKVEGKILYAPENMKVSVYAKGIGSARFFTFNQNDTMFVGTKDNDKIYAIRDEDNDGQADSIKPIDSGLNVPHSLFYYMNDLYLGEENRISVYRNITDDATYESKITLVDNLPAGNLLPGGGHKTRTVAIGPDKKLYVSIGSSCNVCEEKDDRRATIMRFSLDGSGSEIYASGLRNTVGFDFDTKGNLYGADMGRDQIGDDIPPEEINKIDQGKNYGWPKCYGRSINNPEYSDKLNYCQSKTEPPILELQAHSAPLGFVFMKDRVASKWPIQYKNGYFVALHGSWNRTTPTGYKVIWVDTSQSKPVNYNFLSGWLESNAKAWGRPAGLGFDSKGSLYVSDDKQGIIYKITPI